MSGMLSKKAPGAKIRKIQTLLGPEYSIQVIDFENVIYRKINEDYDIEVSGLDNARKAINCFVYVWDRSASSGVQIVEKYDSIDNLTALKSLLYKIIDKYRDSAL